MKYLLKKILFSSAQFMAVMFCKRRAVLFIFFFAVLPLYAVETVHKSRPVYIDVSSNNFPPVNLLDKNGELTGFGRDISEAVMKAVGAEVNHIHFSRWSEVLEWLNSGKADFIHDTGYTEDRDLFLDYSDVILRMNERIFVRADQYDITGLPSLEGKKVACVKKHVTHLYLEKVPGISCHVVDTPAEGLYALVSGKVDAFVYPEQIILYLAQKLRLTDKIKMTGAALRELTWSMVVKEGNAQMLATLNEGIRKIKQSGEYDRIYNKWWGDKLLSGYTQQEVYIIVCTAVVVVGGFISLLALILHNYRLRLANQSLEMEMCQRRQTESELEKSREKYRLAMDAVNDGVWDWRVETGEVSYSKAWADILGEDFVAPLYRAWRSKIHPDDEAEVLSSLQNHLDGHTANWRKTHRLLTKQGDYKWVLGRGRVVKRNANGSPARMVGTMTDITELRQADEALKEAHKRFIKVLNSLDATIYVADMETYEILFMNQYMIESFGRDMTGEICWRSFRNETGPCSECTNDQLVDAEGQPAGVCTWQGKNPVTGRWYANYDRAIEWTDGRLVRLQVATDITEFKKLEEQIRQTQKVESIGRLAGGVAHDFNNMLSIIIGNVELMADDVGQNSSQAAHLKEISDAASRSVDLTQQLLAFARKQTIAPKVIDLNETISNMLKMLGRLIGENIDLIWQPKNNLWPVKADPSQIDQILANLCANARDSIKGAGRVIIKTDMIGVTSDFDTNPDEIPPAEYVVIEFSDTGCGMDEDTIHNLFEPFFTTKDAGRGTGLGLATVYGIVKQNQGFIYVDSSPGQGSTFKIYFPKHIREAPAEETRNPDMVLASGSETILVVEDEISILNMIEKMLVRIGYRVLPASGPSEAIRICAEYRGKIHLLITDVVMPEMNGLELSRRLKQSNPALNCLFMSGYTADIIAHQGSLNEGVAFISKPFSQAEFAAKMREVLGRS